MKNLKKLISVVLCVAMLASFMVVGASAVSYGDVDATKGYYSAVEVLSSLDILKGDENGNFNPDAEIKRSEFAAVVCRALGQESAATSTVSKFADVSTDHWAVGYIGWAAGKKIVNGYEDGTFRADNAVTYQEAVKMIMCALGYGPLAESDSYGGYPYGYLSLAGSYGVTDGISADPTAAASRALVAELVYNALEAPLMEKTYTVYGEAYEIYDGSKAVDYEEKTILSQYLDIVSVRAKVKANYKTDADKYVAKDGRKMVLLDVTKWYNETDEADAEDGDLVISKVFVGDTNASDYLSMTVDAYIYFDEDDNAVIKAIVPSTKATETLTVSKDIDTADVTGSTVTFKYWEDIENDSRPTEVDIKATADVYVNSELIGSVTGAGEAAFEAVAAADFMGSIEFVGDKGDDFDQIFITVYEYAQVEAVDVEGEAIELTDGYIELGEDYRGDGFVYTIYKDGAVISLADIAADDVLTFVYPGDNKDSAAHIDIYVSSATVTGTVTGAKSDKSVYYIDGEEYTPLTNLKVGDEGVFYLTHDGKIYDSKATSSLSDNYAYILQVGAEEVFQENSYQLRLFTKDGATVTYDVASTVSITAEVTTEVEGRTVTTIETVKAKTSDETQDAYFAVDGTSAFNVPAMLTADTEANAKDKAALRLITFSLNGNEINKISFAAATGADGEDFNVKEIEGGSYKPATGKFGSYYFGDATKVFYAPVKGTDGQSDWAIDKDDVALISSASLDEDQNYDAYAYATSEKVMGATVVYSDLGFAGKANALAVVTSVAEGLNAENDKATTITLFQSGSKATYAVDEDVTELDAVEEGDIIQFVVNGAGEISQAQIVWDGSLTAYADGVTADESDITFVEGYVVDYEKGAYVLAADYDDEVGTDYTFDYETGCTLAMVTNAKAGTNSYVTNVSSTSAFKYTNTKSSAPTVYYMVARLVDGEIVDAVEYNLGTVSAE